MAVTNGWGQGAVNNTNDWGKGKTTATNDWGKIYDSSASGDTSLGTATTFPNTQSILLDGVDDFVDCGNPSSLQITGELSISAWFKTTYTGGTQMIVGRDAISGTNRRAYSLFWSSSTNTIRFYVWKSGNSTQSVSSTSTVTDGNWHHVLGVNDGSDLKIYIDGVLEGTTIGGGGTIQSGTPDFYIGRRTGFVTSLQAFWQGHIDEVAVWNSDQSSNIASIYSSSGAVDLSSLNPVSWWRCGDGDTSPTLTDNGSGGNNGTMTNFTAFSTDVPT
tara:strand:- start:279 stop:1100 length:822 start_codon:yes stop_codon:yes gene_type:complete